jgi:hypothetical protein
MASWEVIAFVFLVILNAFAYYEYQRSKKELEESEATGVSQTAQRVATGVHESEREVYEDEVREVRKKKEDKEDKIAFAEFEADYYTHEKLDELEEEIAALRSDNKISQAKYERMKAEIEYLRETRLRKDLEEESAYDN